MGDRIMAGFGFIKQAAQQAGKKMYGFGQKHPIATAGGILGGTYAVGQTDMWKNPENMEHEAVNKWFEKPWDKISPQEAFAVYKRYMAIFDKRMPNASKEDVDKFGKQIESAITNKPNTPEKYKKDFSFIHLRSDYNTTFQVAQGCLGGTRLILDQTHLKNIKVEKNLGYTDLQGASTTRFFIRNQAPDLVLKVS